MVVFAREHPKFTQAEIGEKFGLDQSTISDILAAAHKRKRTLNKITEGVKEDDGK